MNVHALKRNHIIGAALALGVAGLAVGQAVLQNKADAQANTVQAPTFEVDSFWPKPLPNGWLLGMAIGMWDVAFSRDPQQRYLYIADGQNERVRIILRETLEELTAFGDGGRQPGLFYGVHSLATDSKGNLYTTETYEGKRLQKFVFKGVGNVSRGSQGALWPKR